MAGRSSEGSWTTALGVALLALGVVLCAPGLVVVHAVASLLSLRLDAAQVWAFGATTSGVLWLLLSAASRSGWKGLKHHFTVSMLTGWAIAVCWWGLQFQWPRALWQACLP